MEESIMDTGADGITEIGKGVLSGPMFQPAETELFKSYHKKDGAHYNNFGFSPENGIALLRQFFPLGGCDINEENLVYHSLRVNVLTG